MMEGGGGAAGCTLLVVIVDVLVAFIMAGPARVLESTTSALSMGCFWNVSSLSKVTVISRAEIASEESIAHMLFASRRILSCSLTPTYYV